jgi:hypothetical protein
MINFGSKKQSFEEAESKGIIQSMPEMVEGPVVTGDTPEVIDNPEDFRMAVGNAQMNGEDSIEVSEKVFNYIIKNNKTKYFTYGSPGIKVYKVGTKCELDREESMGAEAYHEMITRKAKELVK